MFSLGSDEFTSGLVSQSIPQCIDSGFDLLLLGLDFGDCLPSLKEFEPNLSSSDFYTLECQIQSLKLVPSCVLVSLNLMF